MKVSNHFKNTIQAYLEQRVASDTLFEWSYTKPHKSIDECIVYILNTVQKSGCNGFADEEIYWMAVHYYDEDMIEIGNAINSKVVVNHVVVLTEEEKEEARKEAIQKAVNESYTKLTIKKKPSTKQAQVTTQLTLF